MGMRGVNRPQIDALLRAILLLESAEECERFLEDVCTVKEIQDIAQRFEVARQLAQGKNYGLISKQTGASSATICRVNRCLLYGAGGYRRVIEKLDGKTE